jgi:hypothetical protein
MSAQSLTTETPCFIQIRQRMIRELESFLAATIHQPMFTRLIPRVRAAARPARYDDVARNHVVRGENQPC